MGKIAWVGRQQEFERYFKVRRPVFVDTKNDKTYYCISRIENAIGRHFDKVEIGYGERDYKYYAPIYHEIENTRIIKKGE